MTAEPGTACLCAIARDEHEADVREWVCYHLGLGFGHVALYDNGSRRPLRETLSPLLAIGAVSVVDFPQREAPQLSAYFHALRQWRGRVFWLAFLDIDEFLVPLSPPAPDACPALPRLLRPYERFGGLVLHWMMMGAAGHERRPPGGTLCNYREALGLDSHVKSIVRPECVTRPLSPHHFAWAEGRYAVNEDGFPVAGPESYPVARFLRVNHYYYKSRQDFADKIARGLATPVPGGCGAWKILRPGWGFRPGRMTPYCPGWPRGPSGQSGWAGPGRSRRADEPRNGRLCPSAWSTMPKCGGCATSGSDCEPWPEAACRRGRCCPSGVSLWSACAICTVVSGPGKALPPHGGFSRSKRTRGQAARCGKVLASGDVAGQTAAAVESRKKYLTASGCLRKDNRCPDDGANPWTAGKDRWSLSCCISPQGETLTCAGVTRCRTMSSRSSPMTDPVAQCDDPGL